MKAFARFTVARLAILGVCWAVLWLISLLVFEQSTITNLFVLMVALLVSSVISIFLLGPQRDAAARAWQGGMERANERLEESRSAEDLD